jgi:hypothetical protein
VGKDDQYSNPNGYIPAPAASGMPQTLWVTEVMPVAWRGVVGTTDTAFWKSPTFDLRPDLRSGQSMVKAGVPIWDRSARLYVQMFGLTVPGATDNLRVEYREFANTTWGQVTQAGPNRAIANAGFPNQILLYRSDPPSTSQARSCWARTNLPPPSSCSRPSGKATLFATGPSNCSGQTSEA